MQEANACCVKSLKLCTLLSRSCRKGMSSQFIWGVHLFRLVSVRLTTTTYFLLFSVPEVAAQLDRVLAVCDIPETAPGRARTRGPRGHRRRRERERRCDWEGGWEGEGKEGRQEEGEGDREGEWPARGDREPDKKRRGRSRGQWRGWPWRYNKNRNGGTTTHQDFRRCQRGNLFIHSPRNKSFFFVYVILGRKFHFFCISFQDPKARKLHNDSEAIRQEFQKYFDLEFVFDDLESTLSKVKSSLSKLTAETQWVPRNWVYS